MAQRIIMPKLGQTVEESTIVRWIKQEGEQVSKGDILLEIETDKAILEVESFTSGTLLKIVRPEGETVPVMDTIAVVGEPGEDISELDFEKKPVEAADRIKPPAISAEESIPSSVPPAAAKVPPIEPVEISQGPLTAASPQASGLFRISPRASRLAREKVIDPRKINGSGPKGRVIERDVRAFLEEQAYDDLKITPAARSLASRHNIDLLSVGKKFDLSRIDVSAVRQALAEAPKPLPRIRQVIAQRLTQSFRSAPHFYVTVSVDMTDLVALRAELSERGVELTFNDFCLKAVALTLLEFPAVNSRTEDGKEVYWNSRVNLGIAVAIEDGLLVPVIFDADRLDLNSIHRQAADLAKRGRNGRLRPEEMRGGTFTLSNMGMMDVENFTAIINPGESAILAVSSVLKKPVVEDDQVVIRSVMKMTLSADHRLVDGALAAQFINAVKARLEDVNLWRRLI